MATGVNQQLAVFRARLRKMQDKGKPSNSELLGLFFDLYEIFMVMSDDLQDEMMSVMSGLPQMLKVDKDTFDKVVERDKKADKGKGQYL